VRGMRDDGLDSFERDPTKHGKAKVSGEEGIKKRRKQGRVKKERIVAGVKSSPRQLLVQNRANRRRRGKTYSEIAVKRGKEKRGAGSQLISDLTRRPPTPGTATLQAVEGES